MPKQVFISYNRDNREWLDTIKKHLVPLAEDEGIRVWDDSLILGSEKYDQDIRSAIALSRVAILLVTPEFLSSDYIRNTELPLLVKAADKKDLTIHWIAIRQCDVTNSGFAGIQAMNELSRPLALLPEEESDRELYSICQKVISATILSKEKNGLWNYLRLIFNYLGLLPFLLLLIILAINMASVLDGFGSILRDTRPTLTIQGTTIIACLATILLLALYAGRVIRSNQPPPPPAFLWRFLYNELPITTPETLNPYTTIRILLIHDDSTESIADSVVNAYRQEKLSVIKFRYTFGFEPRALKPRLESSDALYWFWTAQTSESKPLVKAVLEWSINQSHKPVLLVKFLPEAKCGIHFKKISKREVIPGIWQLLARSSERGYLWREQAKKYWVGSLVMGVVAFMLFVLLIPSSNSVTQLKDGVAQRVSRHDLDTTDLNNQLKKRDYLDKEYLNRLSLSMKNTKEVLEALLKNSSDKTKERIRETLCGFATYAVEDLLSRQEIKAVSGITELTFWRKVQREGESRIYQVAWSQKRQLLYFPEQHSMQDTASIIESAFKHKAFVLWRADAKEGDDLAWSIEGQVLGNWRAVMTSFNSKWYPGFISFKDASRGFFISDLEVGQMENENGLMCVAVKFSNPNVEDGVCLDTALPPDFLSREWTRNYLLRVVSVMDILPDNLLITDKLVKETRRVSP
jgi:hypothetical protein